MANTLALLGLFALFTTGSAVGVNCATASGYCVLDSSQLVGNCTTGNACVHEKCTNSMKKYDLCGDLKDKSVVGTCQADDGDCKYTKFAKVSYTVRSDEAAAAVMAAGAGITGSTFDAAVVGGVSRGATNSTLTCTPVAATNLSANGTFSCPEEGSSGCSLQCVNGSKQSKDSEYVCNASGTWTLPDGKSEGVCTKVCDAPVTATGNVGLQNFSGTTDETTGTITFTKLVANGEVICKDRFEDTLGATGANDCILRCVGNYRVPQSTSTGYGCIAGKKAGDSTKPYWFGTFGVCEDAAVIDASIKIALGAGETSAQLLASTDFKNKFKDAVAGAVSGVESHHVRIITVADASRRLKEEGATELEKVDGTNSAENVGGGLRGIR